MFLSILRQAAARQVVSVASRRSAIRQNLMNCFLASEMASQAGWQPLRVKYPYAE